MTGNLEKALPLLTAAEHGLRNHGMTAIAASARMSRGVLTHGDEGRKLVTEAEDALTALGVRNPARMALFFAPGFGAARGR